ncbi:MAG TPA: TlpA disulfide reductase family protein [Chloroflexota bacterium]|nr:TlpA disulfide reductase family protein [Chloroflexota bacterium]
MPAFWTAAVAALWVVVAVVALILTGVLRQLGIIQLRLGVDPGVLLTEEGLARGTQAPLFEAPDALTGEPIRLADFSGRRLVLVFLTTGCIACRELVGHVNRVARDESGRTGFLAVCFGTGLGCREFTRRFNLEPRMVVDPENKIATEYGVTATPFAFLLDESGVVLVRGIVNTWPHLEALLREEGTPQQVETPWKVTNDSAGTKLGGNSGSEPTTTSTADVESLLNAQPRGGGYGRVHE